jgi:hypothetical protein
MRTILQEEQFHLFAMTGFFKGVATRIQQLQESSLTHEPLKSNLFLLLDRVNLVNLGIDEEWERRKLHKKRLKLMRQENILKESRENKGGVNKKPTMPPPKESPKGQG